MLAAWRGTRSTHLTSAFGRAQTINGQLTNAAGAPLAGATIDVVATPSYQGAAAQNASSYQGSELDLILTWNAKKYLQVQGGYAHFFAGNYLTDTGAYDDANFGYVQATIKF